VAESRYIRCDFCTPKTDLRIPELWTVDYAMSWFYAEHLTEHVDQMTAEAYPICRTCRRIVANDAPVHRPCFAPGCYCECSFITTTSERTAHADD
jgi:hypothetical protein